MCIVYVIHLSTNTMLSTYIFLDIVLGIEGRAVKKDKSLPSWTLCGACSDENIPKVVLFSFSWTLRNAKFLLALKRSLSWFPLDILDDNCQTKFTTRLYFLNIQPGFSVVCSVFPPGAIYIATYHILVITAWPKVIAQTLNSYRRHFMYNSNKVEAVLSLKHFIYCGLLLIFEILIFL